MMTIGRIPVIVAALLLLAGLAGGSLSCDEPPSGRLLLSDYPEPFGSQTLIVISGNASAAVVEGAGEVALKLEGLTENKPPVKDDTALAPGDRADFNLVLVGTANSSSLLEQVYVATDVKTVTGQYPGENKGILQILQNPWNEDKAVLIVAGSDEPGLRAALAFLLNDDEIRKLDEEKAIMQFDNGDAVMIPVDMLNSVMEYIRQHHSDAAEFIDEDISWSRTDQTFRDGYTRNVYSGDGWMVIVGLTIVPGAFYDVRAEHITEAIVWVGRIEDGSIIETSYKSNV